MADDITGIHHYFWNLRVLMNAYRR